MLLICSKIKSDEVWLANDVFGIAIEPVTSQNLELRGMDQIKPSGIERLSLEL